MATVNADTIRQLQDLWDSINEKRMGMLDDGMALGEILTQVKDSLPHGEFTPWIEARMPFTPRHARNFMAIAKHRKAINAKRKRISVFDPDDNEDTTLSRAILIARKAEDYESDAAYVTATKYNDWRPEVPNVQPYQYTYHPLVKNPETGKHEKAAKTVSAPINVWEYKHLRMQMRYKQDYPNIEEWPGYYPRRGVTSYGREWCERDMTGAELAEIFPLPDDWSKLEERYYQQVWLPKQRKALEEGKQRKVAHDRYDQLEKDGVFEKREQARQKLNNEQDEEHFQKWKQRKAKEKRWEERERKWQSMFGSFFAGDEVKLDDPQDDAHQQSLFDALDDYFEKFTEPNRKLEALTNVIKHLKKIGAGLHVEIAQTEYETAEVSPMTENNGSRKGVIASSRM